MAFKEPSNEFADYLYNQMRYHKTISDTTSDIDKLRKALDRYSAYQDCLYNYIHSLTNNNFRGARDYAKKKLKELSPSFYKGAFPNG